MDDFWIWVLLIVVVPLASWALFDWDSFGDFLGDVIGWVVVCTEKVSDFFDEWGERRHQRRLKRHQEIVEIRRGFGAERPPASIQPKDSFGTPTEMEMVIGTDYQTIAGDDDPGAHQGWQRIK